MSFPTVVGPRLSNICVILVVYKKKNAIANSKLLTSIRVCFLNQLLIIVSSHHIYCHMVEVEMY